MSAKILVATIAVLLLSASPVIAACDDVKQATKDAIEFRTNRVKDIYDSVPDPEDSREKIAGCLNTIEGFGDIWNMGVTIPSMDQIVDKVCGEVNERISDAVDDAMNKVKQQASQITTKYQVSGDPMSIAKGLLNGLK